MEEIKVWEIWLGYYNLGQGYDPPIKPQLIGKVPSRSFEIACLKFEMQRKLSQLNATDLSGKYIDKMSEQWYYEGIPKNVAVANGYLKTEEEALETFNKR